MAMYRMPGFCTQLATYALLYSILPGLTVKYQEVLKGNLQKLVNDQCINFFLINDKLNKFI